MAVALVVVVFSILLLGGGYASAEGLFAAAAGMAALFVTGFPPRGRRVLARMSGLGGPGGLFGVVVVVALIQITLPDGLDRERSLIQLLRLLGGGSVFLAGAAIGRSERGLRLLTRTLGIAGPVFVATALGLYALQGHSVQDPDGGRLRATFPTSPNTAAAVVGLIALVALGQILRRLHRLPAGLRPGARIERVLSAAWLEMATFGLAVVTLGLTGSRSGAALLMLSAAVLLIWSGMRGGARGRGSVGMRAFALLGVVAVLGLGAGVTLARLPAIGVDALSRTLIYKAHWPFLFDQPVIGHGLGGFLILNRSLVTPANLIALTWVEDMHNVFLQWVEEMGVVGAGAMFGCIGWVLFVIVRGAGRAERSRTWLKTVAAASLFLILQGLVEIALQYEGVVMLWALLLGSAFGLATREPQPRDHPKASRPASAS